MGIDQFIQALIVQQSCDDLYRHATWRILKLSSLDLNFYLNIDFLLLSISLIPPLKKNIFSLSKACFRDPNGLTSKIVP